MAKHERFIARDALAFIEERIHKINNLYSVINEKDADTKYTSEYITSVTNQISELTMEIVKMARWYHEKEMSGQPQQPYAENSEEVQEVKKDPEEESQPEILSR